RLSLVPDGENFRLEANNPTDKPITCRITGRPGFAPLAGVNLTLTLPAGSSDKRPLPSATGTVVVAPIL
ncbi:MAG TPA: hypothetical protein VGM23_13035, partial [Armatimonadota bacterium]